MAAKSDNTLPFNSQAVMKAGAKNNARTEWRIAGVRGLVLNCLPSGSANWYFHYTASVGELRKFRKVKIGGRDAVTLHEARERATELLRDVEAGNDPAGEQQERREALTFQELAERFLTENTRLSAKSRDSYAACLKKDAYPVIGAMPATDVKKWHIVMICEAIEKRGARVQSDRTKASIGGVYRWAMRNSLADVSPTAGIGLRVDAPSRRHRCPTSDELAKLWHASLTVGAPKPITTVQKSKYYVPRPPKHQSPAVGQIIRLAILTGQRRDEVTACRVSELSGLNGDAPMWIIPGDTVEKGRLVEGRTKNGLDQHVPLSRQAAALFREALTGAEGDILFPVDMGRVKVGKTAKYPHIDGHSVTKAMQRLRDKVGVVDVTCHDMRRAISGYLKNEGVGLEVRDLILNHKNSESVTETTYSQNARMTKQVAAAMQLWADHVWTITGQAAPVSVVAPAEPVAVDMTNVTPFRPARVA
jgi:integrase